MADLGQRDDAVADAEQAEDAKVLLALGFPALGCGDDEDACVDTTDAGEHVLEKADVAGHVDERDATTRWQFRPGKPEVDGQATSLFLLEPIRVGAGECFDQGGLAVVDVTGGGDDVHQVALGSERSAPATTSSSSGWIVRRSSTVVSPTERSPWSTRAMIGWSSPRSASR